MKKHLYDIFADKWLKPGGTVWVISDTHFNDAESQGYRHSYPGDDELVKKINAKAGKNDTLILLGDVGDIECVRKLKAGYKILIMGNHDKGASNYKREIVSTSKVLCWRVEFNGIRPPVCLHEEITIEEAEEKFGNVKDIIPVYEQEDNHLFDEVYEGPVMINDRVILSHEPVTIPEYMFNIHGHTHGLPHKYDDKHLNMCAEAIDYTPINMLKLIQEGLLKDTKSIHELTVADATKRKIKRNLKTVDKMLEELK